MTKELDACRVGDVTIDRAHTEENEKKYLRDRKWANIRGIMEKERESS